MIFVFEFDVTIYNKYDTNVDANIVNGDANNGTNDANTGNEVVLNNTTDDQFVCGIIYLLCLEMACPATETKVSLFLYEMDFYNLKFYRKYDSKNSQSDNLTTQTPTRINVGYLDRIMN